MRIVIELGKSAEPPQVLRDLYKRTPMQGTFSIINLALVNGEPRLLTLKQALRVFLDHRLEVTRRRSEFELAQAQERAHLLEGLLIAIKHLDEAIKIIRAAKDTDEARAKLIKRFDLSEAQTTAILDMPLKRLAALERKKIEDEYQEKQALIKRLERLLASPKLMREMIQDELRALKQKYADRRRTQLVDASGVERAAALTAADLAPDHDVWVIVLADGTLVGRTPAGKTAKLTASDVPLAVLQANTRDLLYFITQKGRAATVPVYSLPEVEDVQQGVPWKSVSALDDAARVVAVVAVSPDVARRATPGAEGAPPVQAAYLTLATAGGMVKKTSVADLPGPSAQAYTVINVAEEDAVIGAQLTTGQDELLLITSGGRAIRFKEEEVRAMGLVAAGVMGIKPGEAGDRVVGMDVAREKGEALMVAADGQAKRTPLKDFPTQGRYGQGVTAADLTSGQRLVGMVVGEAGDRLVAITSKGNGKPIKFEDVSRRGRPSKIAPLLTMRSSESLEKLVMHRGPYEPPEIEEPQQLAMVNEAKKKK
jgi:DNA gyrase subunit A